MFNALKILNWKLLFYGVICIFKDELKVPACIYISYSTLLCPLIVNHIKKLTVCQNLFPLRLPQTPFKTQPYRLFLTIWFFQNTINSINMKTGPLAVLNQSIKSQFVSTTQLPPFSLPGPSSPLLGTTLSFDDNRVRTRL